LPESGVLVRQDAHSTNRGGPPNQWIVTQYTQRLDADGLAAPRATDDGWHTQINDSLLIALHLAGRG
jgi:uncharacterized protein (DUF4415 family)